MSLCCSQISKSLESEDGSFEYVMGLYSNWLHDNADQFLQHMARMVQRSDIYPLIDIVMRINLLPSIIAKLRLLCSAATPTECSTDCLDIVEEILRRADGDVIRKLLQRDQHDFVAAVTSLLPRLIENHPRDWSDDQRRLVKVVQDVLTRLSAC